MQRLCEIIDRKIDEGFFTPYAKLLNCFVKQLGA
uniref:SAM-dependent methyltransferase n=1 Tax=Heterorhabditis bacteriophora TaxID=37862 RepID=A0A1I7WHK5_HETBA